MITGWMWHNLCHNDLDAGPVCRNGGDGCDSHAQCAVGSIIRISKYNYISSFNFLCIGFPCQNYVYGPCKFVLFY